MTNPKSLITDSILEQLRPLIEEVIEAELVQLKEDIAAFRDLDSEYQLKASELVRAVREVVAAHGGEGATVLRLVPRSKEPKEEK